MFPFIQATYCKVLTIFRNTPYVSDGIKAINQSITLLTHSPLADRSAAVTLPSPVLAPVTNTTLPSSLFLLLHDEGLSRVAL